jgi:hypothetical protein
VTHVKTASLLTLSQHWPCMASTGPHSHQDFTPHRLSLKPRRTVGPTFSVWIYHFCFLEMKSHSTRLSTWLLSCNIVFSRFIYIRACCNVIPFYRRLSYLELSLLIHSCTDEHLGGSICWLLAIVNREAMNNNST